MDDATLERLAELIVVVGANVQPGQIVGISTEPGKERLTRAVAASAYRHGAKFVDPFTFDVHVKRARIEHAPADTLDFVPEWYGGRLKALARERGARIGLGGPTAPGLLDDLDPERVGRDRLPWLKEILELINDRTTNWTAAPCPTPGWAELVHPELEPAAALARLSDEVAHVCRLDEADPIEAWRQRLNALGAVAERLSERRFDSLHFAGPGTDLTIGLLPSGRWATARFRTVDGIPHLANVPTEEVFTSPDPERTEGSVRSTKPLVLNDGTVIRGLEVRFEGGRAVSVNADSRADVMRGRLATDAGAPRLGEVALVDREGRIGKLGTIFYDTLLDENAASHIAFGDGFGFVLGESDAERRNRSAIHIDFMIGGDDVDVTGLTRDGERVPVLRGGDWQI
ncbi:MAG: aminopeptidase [Gaiellaceae bacterium]